MSDDALAVCQTCGMPVRVVFDEGFEVVRVFAVCGHVESDVRAALDGEDNHGT